MGTKGLKIGPMSAERRAKIGAANRRRVSVLCATCASALEVRPSKKERYEKHFCNQVCYSNWRKQAPPEMQPTWKGGVSSTEAHRRWKKRNPDRVAFLKARRYARQNGASGSHTLEQWSAMKLANEWKCAHCKMTKPLTKDHVIPLSKGGSDDITNIQPLCRNCNSRKWTKVDIHQNPDLLK